MSPSSLTAPQALLYKENGRAMKEKREEREMAFWDLSAIQLKEFRPGIMSLAEMGENLIMVCMEIAPGMEDPGHAHPFDQCGLVLQGEIEMFVEEERRVVRQNQAYFLPAGKRHGWKTFQAPVRILDVSLKQLRS